MAPDFTNAFLVALLCLVFMALCVIWASWGLIAALGIGWIADAAMSRLVSSRP